ncbi:uncharacterized protein LOC117234855 isoform X1 [Bombus vosnesenskii]|uniref:Uncharacterized protein LOC117234855 isoform X1 n=1 Tax=Bombus vosnesenskii TaxID=207650 RepID=A0A6J3KJ75_9HYME|nr:uncharacterized protein LOC117234855 isoform X1 [Bombus vosnesenskii]
MARYLTTYKKDYTWPSTRYKRKITSLSEYASCKCHDRPREIKPLVRCGDDYDWSRTGPMGRLLDPKLYPAKTGPHPETEATRFDQPATYMRKLEEKHPNLYGVLQSTPIDEVIKRVDEDRLKTTYQLDYSDRAAPMEDISTGAPCGIGQEEAKDIDCRPSTRAKLSKVSSGDDRDKIGKRRSKRVAGAEDESQETRLLPWRSEYQDTISKLGQSILKYNIHQKHDSAPAWAAAAL